MFAILVNDTLYLKADELTARAFAAEGKGPFRYRRKGRAPVAMSYWEVPERLVAWARPAHAVALAASPT
jgi:DNA transformation protein and related proteins